MIYNAYLRFVLLIFFLLSVKSYSQDVGKDYVWKTPLITVNGSYSYVIPLQGLRGSGVPDFFQFQNYGCVTGIAFNMDIKVALNKKRNLRAYLSLGFVQANRDDSVSFIDSNTISHGYPLTGSSTYGVFAYGNSRVVIRDVYIALGIDHTFGKNKVFIPFVGAEVSLDYVYGYYVQDPNPLSAEKNFNIKGGLRGGFGFNAGTNIRMLNNVGVVLGAKYRFANLIGKNSNHTTSTDSMDLLDKASPSLNTNLSKDRNIGYLQFYLGLSLFLGLK